LPSHVIAINIELAQVHTQRQIRLAENSCKKSAQLIVPSTVPTSSFGTLECLAHSVDDANDRTNPRATNVDMTINKAAGLLVDLLGEEQDSNTGVCRITSA